MLFTDRNYINGKWQEAANGAVYPVYNPVDGTQIGSVPMMGAAECREAIAAAEHALIKWKAIPPKERAIILEKVFDLLTHNRELMAKTIVIEQGKSIHEARTEVDYAASFFKWFAQEARRIYGDIVPQNLPDQQLMTFKEPVGVVGAIAPWNFPIAMVARKIAPALAAGCTMVLKSSEETPFSALLMAKIFEEAGVPAGVINILSGDAAAIGLELTSNPAVKMLTFTGSTRVGKLLMQQCSSTVKKVALELGGNAPFIIFEDADIDKAVLGVYLSKLRNGGQSCICANRIFVHKKIRGEFLQKLTVAFAKIKVGNGLDENVDLGPLINQQATAKIESLLQDSLQKGGKILYQAEIAKPTACFAAPTIIENISDDVEIFKNEIFGPVASLFGFEDEEEVVKRANKTNYGLASYFYTENRHRITRMISALEYGLVGVNSVAISSDISSFGGIKESGVGREGGRSGIAEYLEDKFVAIQ